VGTKDLTHEALCKALSENTPLTSEQRCVLLSAIADDKRWQRVMDAESARLNAAMNQLARERTEVLMTLIGLANATAASATMSQGQDYELSKARKVIDKYQSAPAAVHG